MHMLVVCILLASKYVVYYVDTLAGSRSMHTSLVIIYD